MQNDLNAPSAEPVFYRTYSRKGSDGRRESWEEAVDRAVGGLVKVGSLTPAEEQLIKKAAIAKVSMPSGRWLWCGGTPWIDQPENFSGGYNCTSTNVVDWKAFGLMMDLAMMGCGTGAVLEPWAISQLPKICNFLEIDITGMPGESPPEKRVSRSLFVHSFSGASGSNSCTVDIWVGDSRQGWVAAYSKLLELASEPKREGLAKVSINMSSVRPQGELLKGFGGVANPAKLPMLWDRIANVLNGAIGRRLTALECCLLIDEAAAVVVAGSIRRSAGIRQFGSDDAQAACAKDNLWKQDEEGKWQIDPDRDALRMANHTRVFHRKPTLDEMRASVRKQYYSGEGAIQYAPEAIARANADLWDGAAEKADFLRRIEGGGLPGWLVSQCPGGGWDEVEHRTQRYGLNPCAEIIGTSYHCNLAEVHLNRLDPNDLEGQQEAVRAAAISVASLLHHKFVEPRYQQSREWDPIIGVSLTGLFDFFVHAFGVEWLQWWAEGRPETAQGLEFKRNEAFYLANWRETACEAAWDYCDRHGLKRPNRVTTVQPGGTKSLLTGAAPGWHPPKAQRFIRRITFRRGDPIAQACISWGYNVVPSQSDKDEDGNLLDNPLDPRCTEWLVEIPTEVSWANLPGADQVDISRFSALAQFDFYMQVQTHYTQHNTSATIELREDEIDPLADRIYEAIQKDEGYISAALLARFDSLETFPRLPFEPITKEAYAEMAEQVEIWRSVSGFASFAKALEWADKVADSAQQVSYEAGPVACDSEVCSIERQS